MGLALVPEPLGWSDPEQVMPRLKSRLLPGAKVTPLTVAKLFHGLVCVPLPLVAAEQSTKKLLAGGGVFVGVAVGPPPGVGVLVGGLAASTKWDPLTRLRAMINA